MDINSKAENSFVAGLISSNAWIGYNDVANEGEFVWTRTGQSGIYQNWAKGAPDIIVADNTKDCVIVQHDQMFWNDLECDQPTRHSVCKIGEFFYVVYAMTFSR